MENYEIGINFKAESSTWQQTFAQMLYCCGGLMTAFAVKCIVYKCREQRVDYFEDIKTIGACTAIIAPWNTMYDLVIMEDIENVELNTIALASFGSGATSGIAEAFIYSGFNISRNLWQENPFSCRTITRKFAIDSLIELLPNFLWQFTYSGLEKEGIIGMKRLSLAVTVDLGTRTIIHLAEPIIKNRIQCLAPACPESDENETASLG